MNSSVVHPCVDINLSDSDYQALITKAKDWVIMHGAGLRSKERFSEDEIQIAPFFLLPSPYPKKEFKLAQSLQTLFNELMHKVAHDSEFLSNTLKSTIEADEFTRKLFNIYNIVKSEGFIQNISLCLLRSDYMLHSNEKNAIKQVEINTISAASGGFADITTSYHKFILKELGYKDKVINIPENNATLGFSMGLVEAWKMYNKEKAVILFIVEDVSYIICDQRMVEFKIGELNSEIKVIRKTLTELFSLSKLGPNKELLVEDKEVAVVYFRTAFQVEAYPSEKEWDARLLLERSRAIKGPSIQYQLAGTKKVQQELASPGVLERFITDPQKAAKIKETFMGLYSLDMNEEGDKAVSMALDDPHKYVLKPQREGGGNNVYGDDIKTELEKMKDSKDRAAWILMDLIFPPRQKNYVIRPGDGNSLEGGEFVSELGIFGVVIGDQDGISYNTQDGYLFRTKPSFANEGGLNAGTGALDSPYLVD